jgi:hypothetical protein
MSQEFISRMTNIFIMAQEVISLVKNRSIMVQEFISLMKIRYIMVQEFISLVAKKYIVIANQIFFAQSRCHTLKRFNDAVIKHLKIILHHNLKPKYSLSTRNELNAYI